MAIRVPTSGPALGGVVFGRAGSAVCTGSTVTPVHLSACVASPIVARGTKAMSPCSKRAATAGDTIGLPLRSLVLRHIPSPGRLSTMVVSICPRRPSSEQPRTTSIEGISFTVRCDTRSSPNVATDKARANP